MYAESDGAGGIQNTEVRTYTTHRVRAADITNFAALQVARSDGTDVTRAQLAQDGSGHMVLLHYNESTSSVEGRFQHKKSGGWFFDDNITLESGETVVDYASKHVPRAFIDPSLTGAFDLGTNPGSFGSIVDSAVDGNSAAGTLHAYNLALDATTFAIIAAESDGAGGIQNARLSVPVPLALLAQSGTPGYTGQGAGYYDTGDETPKYADSGGAYQRPLARQDTEQYDIDESGTVNSGNVGVMWATNVPNNGTIEVYRGSLLLDTLEAAPSGLDLIIYTGDNAGSATKRATIISGDGSTVHDDDTGTPLTSWTNGTGGALTTAIGIDNGNFNTGTGSNQDAVASVVGQVV